MSILIFSCIFLCLDHNPWYHSGAFIAPIYSDNEVNYVNLVQEHYTYPLGSVDF